MLPAKQVYFAVRTTIFLPPSWTLKLTESWGRSKRDSKGEVDGLKWRRKWGRGGQHPRCFNGHDQCTSGLSSKKNETNKKHIIVLQFSADNSLRQPHQRRTSFGFLLVSQKSTLKYEKTHLKPSGSALCIQCFHKRRIGIVKLIKKFIEWFFEKCENCRHGPNYAQKV